MRLNILNKTVVVNSALEKAKVKEMNPKFGGVFPVNEEAFRYSVFDKAMGTTSSVIVERVDLSELFKNIPQDITGIEFGECDLTDLSFLMSQLDLDESKEECIVDNEFAESSSDSAYCEAFVNWKRFVGLRGLPRNEVELSVSGTDLFIDAKNAVFYKGTVSVKFTDTPVVISEELPEQELDPQGEQAE